MRNHVIVWVLGLLVMTPAFARDAGAVGIGFMSQSSEGNRFGGGGIGGTLFVDVGSRLAGPLSAGLELEGDIKRREQSASSLSQNDVPAFFSWDYYFQHWLTYATNNEGTLTYTLWDFNASPRVYLNYDIGGGVELLGFGGINFNWQSLEETITAQSGNWGPLVAPDGTVLYPGDTWTHSHALRTRVMPVVGLRLSVSVFYLDYSRFVESDTEGDYSWSRYNKNRWGAGFEARF